MKIALVTDSTANLSKEEIEKYNINVYQFLSTSMIKNT